MSDGDVKITITVYDKFGNSHEESVEQAKYETDDAFMQRVGVALTRLKERSS